MTGTMWQGVCGPWSTANKKQGLQSYNHEELLSANNLNKLGRECSALDDIATAAHTWILARWDPEQRTQPGLAGLMEHGKW